MKVFDYIVQQAKISLQYQNITIHYNTVKYVNHASTTTVKLPLKSNAILHYFIKGSDLHSSALALAF